MFKKRVICLLLSAVLLLSLCACGKSADSSGSGKSDNADSGLPAATNLKGSAVGDVVTFGNYEQDNDTSNGKEPVEWIVLSKENNRILVISKYALDCQPYHNADEEVVWENCTLRTWLNDTFLNEAFSEDEQKCIREATVTADEYQANTSSSGNIPISQGNDTTDKVFLLSQKEANELFSSDDARKCAPTEYAWAILNDQYQRTACDWWLRTAHKASEYLTGDEIYSICLVSRFGNISGGSDVFYKGEAMKQPVRPAMWIGV